MRATLHKPLFDLAQARRQHATRPAAGKQRASPTRPDPPQPVPGPSVGFCIPSLFADQIIHSRRPPRLLHPRPLSLPAPVQSAPDPPGRIDQDQRASGSSGHRSGTGPWRIAIHAERPVSKDAGGVVTAGGASERSSLSRSSPHRRNKKEQFADATDSRALAQKYGPAPNSLSRVSSQADGRDDRWTKDTMRQNDRHYLANAFKYSIMIPPGSGMMRDATAPSSTAYQIIRLINRRETLHGPAWASDASCTTPSLLVLLPNNKQAPYLTPNSGC